MNEGIKGEAELMESGRAREFTEGISRLLCS